MTISELIKTAEFRLSHLNDRRTTAERLGHAAEVASIDVDVAETQATLDKLRTLTE
jgi:hypothetical protein